MLDKVQTKTSVLESRLSELDAKVGALLSGELSTPRLDALRVENQKLKYRLQILMSSISEVKGDGPPAKSAKKELPKPDPGVDFLDKSLLCQLKVWFSSAISAAYPDLPEQTVLLTAATREAFGDYQCNSAMTLAPLLSQSGAKVNPRQVAEAIKAKLSENKLVTKVEIAGPGFINIHLDHGCLAGRLADIFTTGVDPPKLTKRLRVIVDFSSPNVAKEMHVGHLRSTIIGDCIARLMEWLGHDVLRLNHIGDWGTQFGMLIAHLQDKLPSLQGDIPPVSDLMALYKESKTRFDNDKEFGKRAHECVVKLQRGDPEIINAWKAICDKSREEFQKLYNLLDVKLVERGESFYQTRMDGIVQLLREKGLLQKDEGREVLFPEGMEVPLTVVKSNGSYTYDTSDMAAIHQRIQEEKGDWLIYVVDSGQGLHFQTIYAAARAAGIYDPAKIRVDHVAFGVVLGEGRKKLKTREGETIRLASLIDEGLKRCDERLTEKERQKVLTPEEYAAAQQSVALGCIKYADLSHNRLHDYVFSFDRMLDDKGNTAAYLLYAYTRIRSIARNCGVTREQIGQAVSGLTFEHPKELKLTKTILRFWDAIAAVLEDLHPHMLCDYLYDLATTFTEFYDVCYCIQKDKEGNIEKIHLHRLLLCEVTADVMAACFQILGLHPVQKM